MLSILRQIKIQRERDFILPSLRLGLTLLLENGFFFVWLLESWILPKMQRAPGTPSRSHSGFVVFISKAQEGWSVCSFSCYKIKLLERLCL